MSSDAAERQRNPRPAAQPLQAQRHPSRGSFTEFRQLPHPGSVTTPADLLAARAAARRRPAVPDLLRRLLRRARRAVGRHDRQLGGEDRRIPRRRARGRCRRHGRRAAAAALADRRRPRCWRLGGRRVGPPSSGDAPSPTVSRRAGARCGIARRGGRALARADGCRLQLAWSRRNPTSYLPLSPRRATWSTRRPSTFRHGARVLTVLAYAGAESLSYGLIGPLAVERVGGAGRPRRIPAGSAAHAATERVTHTPGR